MKASSANSPRCLRSSLAACSNSYFRVSSNIPKVSSPKTQKARLLSRALKLSDCYIQSSRLNRRLCHVLEIYIRVAMRGLEGIEVKRGLDKNFAQVASQSASQPLKTAKGWASPPFWQARFHDFNVWATKKRVEKLRYMHRNLVNRGL